MITYKSTLVGFYRIRLGIDRRTVHIRGWRPAPFKIIFQSTHSALSAYRALLLCRSESDFEDCLERHIAIDTPCTCSFGKKWAVVDVLGNTLFVETCDDEDALAIDLSSEAAAFAAARQLLFQGSWSMFRRTLRELPDSSQTLNALPLSDSSIDVIQNLENDMPYEKRELRDFLVESIRDWMETELPARIEAEIEAALIKYETPDFLEKLMCSAEQEIKAELRKERLAELREEMRDELDQLRGEVEETERAAIRQKLREELEAEVRQELALKLAEKLKEISLA
jgi:hypothetical protein